MSTRSERELTRTDTTDIYEQWHAIRSRYSHVFDSPNSRYYRQYFDALVQQAVQGKRVLEIGCGGGGYAARIASFGATYVFAVDLSQKRIAQAKTKEIPGKLEYAVQDLSVPMEGRYDVIVGNAVLHHLDYQDVLQRLYRDNLNPGGVMLFYEPLGGNPLIRLYQAMTKSAHTEDEQAFLGRDLRWLRRTFPSFEMTPINYFSLPLGVVSSFLFKSPDNPLLRAADRADRALARRVPALHSHFRNVIFVIRKDGARADASS